MKKGILFFSTKSLQDGGGYQEWLTQTSALLSDSYRTGIMTGTVCDYHRWTKTEAKRRVAKQVKYHKEITYHTFGSWCIPSLSKWFFLYSIFRKYDYIYLNHFFRYRDPIAKFLAKLSGAKIIWGFHDSLKRAGVEMYKTDLIWKISTLFTSAIHTINSATTAYFKKYAKNVFFIPNYILDEELPRKKTASFGGPVIFIGNYDKRKGIDFLLSAIPEVLKKHPDQKFSFFGSGNKSEMIDDVSRRFPSNVVNYGYTKNKDKMFTKASFLISCSREEPFGLVVIEAMSHGVPVIASKANGPKDIIISDKDGIFIETLNPRGVEDTINKALSIPVSKYTYMSAHAFMSVKSRYSSESFKREFERMLISLTSAEKLAPSYIERSEATPSAGHDQKGASAYPAHPPKTA